MKRSTRGFLTISPMVRSGWRMVRRIGSTFLSVKSALRVWVRRRLRSGVKLARGFVQGKWLRRAWRSSVLRKRVGYLLRLSGRRLGIRLGRTQTRQTKSSRSSFTYQAQRTMFHRGQSFIVPREKELSATEAGTTSSEISRR